MIGHRFMGMSLLCTGDIAAGPSAFRSGDRALRSCRASSAGDAIWPRRSGINLVLSVVGPVVAWLSRGRACGRRTSAQGCARDRPSRHFDVRAVPRIVDPVICCGNYAAANAQVDEAVALADEKGALLWKALGMLNRGCAVGPDRQSLGRSPNDHLRDRRISVNGSQQCVTPLYLSYLASAYAELGQFDDAWRCIGEAMTAVETTKESGARPRSIALPAKSR